MGCSIEWIPNLDSASIRVRASAGEKAPLASSLSSRLSALNRLRISLSNSSSLSKPIPPILSFTQRNPASSLSRIRPAISCPVPIHTSPFMGISSSPAENADGNGMRRPPLARSLTAVFHPKSTDPHADRSDTGTPAFTSRHNRATRSS